jgi:hypothetical protein
MGKPVYIADPVVASYYRVHPGEWAYIAADLEAAWLVQQKHAYSMTMQHPPPKAGHVDPGAPLPFVPFVAKVQARPQPQPQAAAPQPPHPAAPAAPAAPRAPAPPPPAPPPPAESS